MPQSLKALLPHSPLLIDEIGKENKKLLKPSIEAYQKIISEIKDKQIEDIIIISQHGILDNHFSFGISPEFEINFNQFACFKKRNKLKSNIVLADKLLEFFENDIYLEARPISKLDHAVAVPIELIRQEHKDIKLLPIYSADKLSWQEHYSFGQKLQEFVNNQTEKIAIIASGNLSHRLKVSSPGGFSPKGVKFDNKIMQYLNDSENIKDKILNLNYENVLEAKESVIKPLLILLGIIGQNYQGKKLAYQNDFGVGYLSYIFN